MTLVNKISNYSIKFLSGLANNSDSIAPMAAKDTISNCAIVATYKNEGTKDDAREKGIEEFGTGLFWLFGIPAVKTIINKTIYPFLKLNPDFDIRHLKGKSAEDISKMAHEVSQAAKNNSVLKSEVDVFNSLNDKNAVLSSFKNKDLYKGLFAVKFASATAIAAVALSAVIKYKQKTTQKRIQKDFEQKSASGILINKSVQASKTHDLFTGNLKDKKAHTPSFKGLGELFMYNPIANTALLDGVITTTRLKEARKGERKEVAFKELFQMLFIYGLAKPIQFAFEKIGNKLNLPVELDPQILFDKNVKQKVEQALKTIKDNDLNNEKDVVSKIYQLAQNEKNSALIDILAKNNVVKLAKDSENSSKPALSYLNVIGENDLRKTMSNIQTLSKNMKNLPMIKAYKVVSVLGNIAIGALAIGVLQPKLNILMRKLLNNGDNRNPAIVAQENEMRANRVKLL